MKKKDTRKTRVTTTRKRTQKPVGSKKPKKGGGSLEDRLENEFSESINRAKSYLKDPERLRQLVTEAARKVASLPKEQFKDTWAYLQAMLRLVRAYYRREYVEVPLASLLLIVGAIVYLINPLDLLPDWIPTLGLLDDAFIVALAVRRTRQTLDEFMVWEISRD